MPHQTQAPVPVGGSFTYRIQFPDPGLYWYHPHIQEDYTQELGLYGNILVVPSEPDYWPPANCDVILTLDDGCRKRRRLMRVTVERVWTLTPWRSSSACTRRRVQDRRSATPRGASRHG